MKYLEEALDCAAVPVGYVYESATGFQRVPVISGDQEQVTLLETYDGKVELVGLEA